MLPVLLLPFNLKGHEISDQTENYILIILVKCPSFGGPALRTNLGRAS